MTRQELLDSIAHEKHGRSFSEIEAMTNRAYILQEALDRALEVINKNNHLQIVVGQSEQLVCPHQTTRTPNEEKTEHPYKLTFTEAK
jgi:hypothetical protein